MTKNEVSFSILFDKYRFHSGLYTYFELGKALADEGLIFDDSTFSKWRRGIRTPKNREIVVLLLRVFAKNNGISTVDEANKMLFSLDQRNLNEEEITRIFNDRNYQC